MSGSHCLLQRKQIWHSKWMSITVHKHVGATRVRDKVTHISKTYKNKLHWEVYRKKKQNLYKDTFFHSSSLQLKLSVIVGGKKYESRLPNIEWSNIIWFYCFHFLGDVTHTHNIISFDWRRAFITHFHFIHIVYILNERANEWVRLIESA